MPRVLIVDDQAEIREITTTVLESEGYQVAAMAAGSHAVEALGNEPFDLVLLDINMPGMDGWQTLRMIRADDRLSDLPVVMFSVKGELSDKVQSLKDGASGYITKPFVVDELLARVKRVLEATGEESE